MAPAATSPIQTSSLPSTFSSSIIKSKLLPVRQITGLRRTRDEAGLDLDDTNMSVTHRPIKIPRTVTFNDRVQEEIYTTSPNAATLQRELDSIKIKVKKAILDHTADGRSSDVYDGIKAVFSGQERHYHIDTEGDISENDNMRMHLLALTSHVSMLRSSCSGLVKAILNCEWVGRDDKFVRDYMFFLGNLATAHGGYVPDILSGLVKKFSGMSLASGRLPDCPIVLRDELFARIHKVLRYLLGLMPSASGTLAPILSANFPSSDESKKSHILYVNNLVRLKKYAPELRSEIFRLTTDRVIKLDMQMRTDFDELDEQDAAMILNAVTSDDLQDEDDDDDDDSDIDSVTSDDGDEVDIKQIQAKVEKLDVMMDYLFEMYEPYFKDPDNAQAHNTMEMLLSHFRTIILPMYRSRHTQFLLFHFAQRSKDLVDMFAGECAYLAFNSERSDVVKQSAAAYLASFVARGRQVSPARVIDVFHVFGSKILQMLDEHEAGCRGPDLHRYSTFYATTQALIYIFCFRWRDLIIKNDSWEEIETEEDYHDRDLEWQPNVRALLERTIYSKLNPLKVCSPVIVAEFAKIALHLQFMYVYPKIESNRHVRLAQRTLNIPAFRESAAGTSVEDIDSWNQLDAVFPFDPYQLPVSKRKWIVDDYTEWRDIVPLGMPANDDETDDSSDEEEVDDEEEYDEEDTATEVGED